MVYYNRTTTTFVKVEFIKEMNDLHLRTCNQMQKWKVAVGRIFRKAYQSKGLYIQTVLPTFDCIVILLKHRELLS